MIKYIGSKRSLTPAIVAAVRSIAPQGTVLDLFSGSSRVGHALKRAGYRVIANDHNAYASTLATCYVQTDRDGIERHAEQLIREFNALPGAPGYFTDTFCVQSRFFRPENGERVDTIREAIESQCLEPELKSVLLVSLMEAADRVDSTTGVHMAYLKSWAPRAQKRLELRLPSILPQAQGGKGWALQLDAIEAAGRIECDIAYLDPPYNQHSYLGNYHIWETLVRWDKPTTYGRAKKRDDCPARRSAFNSRKVIRSALATVIRSIRATSFVVSFSDEGFISKFEMERMLATRGKVAIFEHDHRRYIGSQIGIYSPNGEKVGRAGRIRNTEYLFVVTPHDAPEPSFQCADAPEPAMCT